MKDPAWPPARRGRQGQARGSGIPLRSALLRLFAARTARRRRAGPRRGLTGSDGEELAEELAEELGRLDHACGISGPNVGPDGLATAGIGAHVRRTGSRSLAYADRARTYTLSSGGPVAGGSSKLEWRSKTGVCRRVPSRIACCRVPRHETSAMDWMQLAFLLAGAILGYILAVSRDRLAAIRRQQIAAMRKLHERVLEIERAELHDGQNIVLAVDLRGRSKKRTRPMSDEEVEDLSKLSQWRQKLLDDENRARLWIDAHTVHLVSSYFILMMQCKSWEEFGEGLLIEDATFRRCLRYIFGNENNVLNKIIIRKDQTGEPWLVNCVLLSYMCLGVIQRRIRLEVSYPLCFRVSQLYQRLTRPYDSLPFHDVKGLK